MTEWEAMKAVCEAARDDHKLCAMKRGYITTVLPDSDPCPVCRALTALDAAEVVGVEECAKAIQERNGYPMCPQFTDAAEAVLARIKGGSDEG